MKKVGILFDKTMVIINIIKTTLINSAGKIYLQLLLYLVQGEGINFN